MSGNKRIYELDSRTYKDASKNNDYLMVDGELLDEAKKILVSSFAGIEFVNSSFDKLNDSAKKIVEDIEDFKSQIPTITSGFNNNIRVDFDDNTKTYTFYGSSYDVTSQDDTLIVETSANTDTYTTTFKLSADTYTKGYINSEIDKLTGAYNIVGLNNIFVEREKNDLLETNKFVVSLDGITASKDGNEYDNVSGNSVVINESNTAFDISLSQGISNYSNTLSFSQGDNNSSTNVALAQGSYNTALNVSFAQGVNNYSENNSFAQGENNTSKDISLAQGTHNYAESGSMALGGYASAINGSIAYGNDINSDSETFAYNHSMSFGYHAYSENYSYNFYGDSAKNHSFSVGHHGLVDNYTTALGKYNEPRFVSGDNPYTFALGDGTKDNPHTFFRVDTSGVFYSTAVGHEIDLTKMGESETIKCDTLSEYEILRKKPENLHKVFIVG